MKKFVIHIAVLAAFTLGGLAIGRSAEPQPLIFHAKVIVPQNTVLDQQEAPSAAQLQADMQAGLDADATLPSGTFVKVWQEQ